MAKMGRKRKPTPLKALQGNPGGRPLNANEPAPSGQAKRPWGLKTRDPRLAKRWDEWAPRLMEVGLLTPIDVPAFMFMAMHHLIADEAIALARSDGLTRLDEQGIERKHPGLQIWRDNSAHFYKWCTSFGMTPSGRGGLTVPEAKMPTIADALFKMVEESKGK